MEFTAEQIERVANFSGVSREEARTALEQAGGSPLDAVILLERQGRAAAVPGGAWSTRGGTPPESDAASAAPPLAARQRPHRKYTAREVGDTVKNFLLNCTKITVDIWRGEDLLAGVPLVVCVLMFVVAFRLMVVLGVLGLMLRCRYHISGWEGNAADINRAMDQVTETVADWTDRVRKEWNTHSRGKKAEK